MSLARVKNWIAEVLTYSDLNAEFNNILNNPGSLICPIGFNLTFTDATYDIGASGATRPRDLFLSRNATIGGTLTANGVTSLAAGSTDYTQVTGGSGTTSVSAVGATAAVNLVLAAKGVNSILLNTGGGTQAYVQNVASTDEAIILKGGQNGVSVSTLSTTGGSLVVGSDGGPVLFTTVSTTASAANAYLDNAASNSLLRSTSSSRYKRDIETLNPSLADVLIEKARAVWYRSKCDADRKDWSWYGLIAEEVAEIDARLVHWTHPVVGQKEVVEEMPFVEAWTEVTEENGSVSFVPKMGSKSVKKMENILGSELVPDGVQYERLTVLLLNKMQRMIADIEALKAHV